MLICSTLQVFSAGGGNNSGKEEKFDVGNMILHHIADAHDFHIVGDVHLPLPVILYNADSGLDVFLSSKFHHGTETVNGYSYDHGAIVRADNKKFYDFSITKNVFTMLLFATLLFFVFRSMAKQYIKTEGKAAPKGIARLLEPLVLFVRDDIAKENIGAHKYEKFVPYLLAIFFFILAGNLFGLIPFFPGSANVTGNIAVTAVLALVTIFIVLKNSNKHYWAHILLPDAPKWLYPILVPIELLGNLLVKPVTLLIRLFANITGGHIIILSLTSLIFVFSSVNGIPGESLGGGAVGAALAVPFVLFMNGIELFVAFLQAYIFTLLSAIYIGDAVQDGHH